ncbi:MAG: MBL fold metallo-hydrolase [Candidatus Heimdallarchaeota archaeon]
MDREFYEFEGKKIALYKIKNQAGRYKTPNFEKIQEIIKISGLKPKTWIEALDWLFLEDRRIPLRDKLSVDRIGISEEINIFCIEMELSKILYQNLDYLAKKTGWYFYITGVKLGISKLCKVVDEIPRRFKSEDIETWRIDANETIELINIATLPYSTCFLLKVGKYNILLDGGLHREKSNNLQDLMKYVSKLDVIFLSHAHYDHYSGLEDLIENFPNAIILCSKTTLDFYSYRYAKRKWNQLNELDINLFKSTKNIIRNSLNISSGDEICFNNGRFRFFPSGHMPGALMFNCFIDNYNFVYTGDFSYFDNYPIAGARNATDLIQKPINFLLLDSSMCEKSYNSPNTIFSSLKHGLKLKATYGKQSLIAADPASMGLILYITIFNYFRNIQLEEDFDKRPTIVMGREALEHAKVVQQRIEDLHPKIRSKIERHLNPFTSALTHFCKNFSEIASFLNKKNCVFIFGNGDISSGMSRRIIIPIGNKEHNLICLTGALRSEEAMELAAGNNEIIIDNYKFNNKADVFNFRFPKNTLNLHADSIQINKLIEDLKPRKVGLFHNTSRKMIATRANLKKKDYIEETYSFDEKIKILRLK